MTEQMNGRTGEAGKLTNEKRALVAVTAILQTSPLTLEAQAAVALNVATSIVAKMPGARENRGKVINAMTTEFRKRLQAYLPRE